jgi:hypothetical protein
VLPVLAVEEHRARAFNSGDRSIPKADGTCHPGVEVGEGGAGSGHVIGCAGVQDPVSRVTVGVVVELGVNLLLQDEELGDRDRWQRCRFGEDWGRRILMCRADSQHKRGLLFLLGHMGLLGCISLLLFAATVTGPVALLATARTGVVRRRT